MHSGAKYCCKAMENEDRKEAVGFGKMKAASDLGRVVSGASGNLGQLEWTRERMEVMVRSGRTGSSKGTTWTYGCCWK